MGRARRLSVTEPGVALFNDQEFCPGGRFFGVFRLFRFLQSSRQAALISSAAWLLGWVLESILWKQAWVAAFLAFQDGPVGQLVGALVVQLPGSSGYGPLMAECSIRHRDRGKDGPTLRSRSGGA